MAQTNNLILEGSSFAEIATCIANCPPGIIPGLDLNKTDQNYSECPVINLTDSPLDNRTVTVLGLGLNYCPTPKPPELIDLVKDTDQFLRRMTLQNFFHDEDDDKPIEAAERHPLDRFHPKSTWTPARGFDPVLDAFCHTIRDKVRTAHIPPQGTRTTNLNRTQRRLLNKLEKDPHTTIKKGDKGSSIVVMHSVDYARECYRQLSDKSTYQHIPADLTTRHNQEVDVILDKMSAADAITEKQLRGLRNSDPRTPKFYILPKIHKQNVTGRPILSGNGGPTEKISALVDECIKHYVPLLPSYIKDTTDFIRKIESLPKLPENTLLVTLDVTSLYTNIPNTEGISAVLDKVVRDKARILAARWIKELLELVLLKNNFEFNGSHFLQIGGTAMGTRVAPSLANIFMGKIEKKLLDSYPMRPTVWWRYIDDIFCLWTHGQDELTKFIHHLNTQHRTIKFTMENSHDRVNYLDTTVILKNNKLSVDLYTKPTDTHNYLHYTSCHPKHCTQSGPYSQYLRLKRNCTDHNDYTKHCTTMTQHYTRRGYPKTILESNLEKATNKTRDQLLEPGTAKNKKERNPRIPFILTFNPRNPDMKKIVMETWSMLTHSKKAKALYLQNPPIFAYRRCPNIKDTLMNAKIRYPKPHAGTQGKVLLNPPQDCTRINCQICKLLNHDRTTANAITNKFHNIPTRASTATCEDSNLIYLLTCLHCRKQYVGETKRTFRTRLKEHLADTKHQRDTPVANHFNQKDHSARHIAAKVLEVIPKDPTSSHGTSTRKKHEKSWILKLQSLTPSGINIYV